MFTRLFLITTLVVLSTAPVFGGDIYVSNGDDILKIASNGDATTLYPGEEGFNPRGLTVGPDGNLYFAADGAIYRFDPTQDAGSGNPTNIATVAGAEGLAFAANFDLYVSTSGSVYRLHFQPVIPLLPGPGPNPPNPTLGIPTVTEEFSFGSGAGMAFGKNGNLLLAKNTEGGGIFSAAAPGYSSASQQLGPGLNNPIGMAVNTCGEILVGVGTKIERRNKTGGLIEIYVDFGEGSVVGYIGVTSTNEVFAVVTDDSGGQVYRITDDDLPDGTDILPCEATDSMEVTALPEDPEYPLDDLVGLAVPPSSAFITKSFGAGENGTCEEGEPVLLTSSKRTFDFGHHSFTLSFKKVIQCFSVKVTANMSRPQRITFSPAFPLNTEATKYSSKGSFVVEYLADAMGASPGIDYASAPDGVQASALYFTLLSLEIPPRNPGMAKNHDAEDFEGEYNQDITQYFVPSINPLEDPGEWGTDDDISKFVVFNVLLDPLHLCQFDLKEPALSGHPQWRQGATVSVKFSCSNGKFPDLVAYLTIVNTDGPPTPQAVVSRGKEIGNKFSSGSGNNFTYQLDTSLLAVGTYQLIITSNRFAPRDGDDGNPALPNLDPAIIVTVQR